MSDAEIDGCVSSNREVDVDELIAQQLVLQDIRKEQSEGAAKIKAVVHLSSSHEEEEGGPPTVAFQSEAPSDNSPNEDLHDVLIENTQKDEDEDDDGTQKRKPARNSFYDAALEGLRDDTSKEKNARTLAQVVEDYTKDNTANNLNFPLGEEEEEEEEDEEEIVPGAYRWENGIFQPSFDLNRNYRDDGLVPPTTSEDPVPTATPLSLPVAEPETEQRREDPTKKNLIGAGIFLIVVLAIVLAVVVWSADSDSDSEEEEGARKILPLTREEALLQILPKDTQIKIKRNNSNFTSPQFKAFQWVVQDPQFAEYEDWRLRQRFALSCLYFSTGGETSWKSKDHWLSYQIDEYSWYRGISVDADKPYWLPDLNPYDLIVEESEELSHVWLYNNGLMGTIPPEFYLLTSLRSIDLSYNQLSGSIHTQIGNLLKLEAVILSSNELNGLPSQIGYLQNLLACSIQSNNLGATLPTEVGLMDLWALDLHRSGIVGRIPSELGLNEHLITVWMAGNQLTGPIPSEFGQLSALQFFQADYNALTGSIPSEIGSTFRDILSFFDEFMDVISEKMGIDLKRLPFLMDYMPEWLDRTSSGLLIRNNLITGTLPTELALLVHPDDLSLSHNSLSGPIPSHIGLMTDMTALSLGNNLFSSVIPTEAGLLTDLVVLMVQGNDLSGFIPSEIGRLSSLLGLNLANNSLTGSVPEELFLLEDTKIFLQNNILTGPLPPEPSNHTCEICLWYS